MDTIIMNNMTEDIIEYTNKDFGKFLNVGDYIMLHTNTNYKICSKTYDAWNNKWILTVE